MLRFNKYNAVNTKVDGINFDSKSEAKYYNYLKIRKSAGEISYFLMQIPLRLPGGTKYVCDFLVVYPDNQIEYIDVKGVETAVFKIKKREIEAAYPIEIKVVKLK